MVKEIAKDLLRGDSAKEQLSITQKILLETEKKCEKTDSINTILRKKEQNYQEIILNSDEKYNTLQVYTTKVETKLRNEVLKNKLDGKLKSKEEIGELLIGFYSYFFEPDSPINFNFIKSQLQLFHQF